jgi:hypothetical protein
MRVAFHKETERDTPLGMAKYVARHPFGWPGGYDLSIVTMDGGLLCAKCCASEYREIVASVLDDWQTSGWYPAAIGSSDWMENGECCDNCGKNLDGYHTEEELAAGLSD